MDGSCHESPRWVSLLVAEIFYPEARFPNPVPAASSLSLDYVPAKYHHVLPANDFNHMQHKPSAWRSEDAEGKSGSQTVQPAESTNGRVYSQRHMRSKMNSDVDGPNQIDNKSGAAEERSKNDDSQQECDGYDKVGCYVIRVYYDWFLVPGELIAFVDDTCDYLIALVVALVIRLVQVLEEELARQLGHVEEDFHRQVNRPSSSYQLGTVSRHSDS